MSRLIQLDHLIEACGNDPQQLAGLGLLLAMASLGFGMTGDHSPAVLEQINDFQRAHAEIQRRMLNRPSS